MSDPAKGYWIGATGVYLSGTEDMYESTIWNDPLRRQLREDAANGDEAARNALIDWYEERGIQRVDD